MWKLFSKAAQANVNHYNNHQSNHRVIIAVSGAVAAVGISTIVRKLTADENPVDEPIR